MSVICKDASDSNSLNAAIQRLLAYSRQIFYLLNTWLLSTPRPSSGSRRTITATEAVRGAERINLLAETVRSGCSCLTLEPGRFWALSGVVAVVENLECFLHFERMKVAADVALYARGRLSRLALQWLGSSELATCRFIHCGDYDPVGLDEFLRLKNAVSDRASLHIPSDLARLIREHGRPALLADSTAVLGRLRQSHDPDTRTIVQILDETGCGLEQEALLLSGLR